MITITDISAILLITGPDPETLTVAAAYSLQPYKTPVHQIIVTIIHRHRH